MKPNSDLSDEKFKAALSGGFGDPATDDAIKTIAEGALKLPLEKRRAYMQSTIDILNSKIPEYEKTRAEKALTVEEIREKVAVLDEFMKWRVFHDMTPPIIEKNDCSRLHRFIEALTKRRIITNSPDGSDSMKVEGLATLCKNTFVVKHDWAKAFANAAGFEGDIRIPYDYCCFEFRISGKTVVAVAWGEVANFEQGFICFADCGSWWYCFENDENERPILAYIWRQIRAICISLDAEVATHEVVRAPEKLNKKRIEAGKLPLMDYHVVDLAKRHRIANPAALGGTHKSPRLHFVRGHWRHLENAKVWIKWHLRGNPDLGYIQKEYAL